MESVLLILEWVRPVDGATAKNDRRGDDDDAVTQEQHTSLFFSRRFIYNSQCSCCYRRYIKWGVTNPDAIHFINNYNLIEAKFNYLQS